MMQLGMEVVYANKWNEQFWVNDAKKIILVAE